MHEQNGEPPRTCLGFKSMKAQTGDSEDDILGVDMPMSKNVVKMRIRVQAMVTVHRTSQKTAVERYR